MLAGLRTATSGYHVLLVARAFRMYFLVFRFRVFPFDTAFIGPGTPRGRLFYKNMYALRFLSMWQKQKKHLKISRCVGGRHLSRPVRGSMKGKNPNWSEVLGTQRSTENSGCWDMTHFALRFRSRAACDALTWQSRCPLGRG